jgi:hypothetical protein
VVGRSCFETISALYVVCTYYESAALILIVFSRRMVYRAFVLSAIGSVFNVVALMIDANAFFVYVEPLATCLDTKTMELYGDLDNTDNVHSCYKSLDGNPGCVCAQIKTADQQNCFGANLRHARSDCGDILSTYTTNLQLSMIVCLILVMAVPFFCGLTRKSVHVVSDSIFEDLERSLENPLRDSYSCSELTASSIADAINSHASNNDNVNGAEQQQHREKDGLGRR